MPITVRYLNDALQECTIRPTPLVSISREINRAGNGDFIGVTYSITLTGTILEDQGFPLARNTQNNALFPFVDGSSPGTLVGPYSSFDSTISHADYGRPIQQKVHWDSTLDSLFFKQKAIRGLFAQDGQRLEISPIHNDEPAIVCYPRVSSISFAEGNYVNRADYTIQLEADTLLNKDLDVDIDGSVRGDLFPGQTLSTEEMLEASGAFLASFSETWSIEADEGAGEITGPFPVGDGLIPRTYRISHSMNATGKPHYAPDSAGAVVKYEAWEQARGFVQRRLMQPDNDISSYPNVMNQLGSGTLNFIAAYQGFNHVRTEEVNTADGSYSVTENWILASGTAHETYSLSISTDTSSPFVSVSIEGSIAGLSQIAPSGLKYGGGGSSAPVGLNAYDNALIKYQEVTNSGKFGLTSDVFKRADNSVAAQMNSQPTSVSLGTNEFTGEVTYSLSFDNRPTNIISGVLSETISVNDTYPGDVFAMIPVIGRATGPILQYIGGRTEYKRDVSIDLTMDYTDIGYGSGRSNLLLHKPSLVEPTRTQIRALVQELSPAYEPGIRKYFISPPSESWNPKEGSYSFSISWTYELDR
jgi:hypothetical protein